MKTTLLHLLTKNEAWHAEALSLYQKKITPFQKFEIKELKPSSGKRGEMGDRIKAEAQQILSNLNNEDFVIAFDVQGKGLTSEKWAEQLNQILNSGKKETKLICGGPFGLHPDVLKRATLKVSLGPMIMNHLVAEVVILEQWYRAWTILKNLPYHNQANESAASI